MDSRNKHLNTPFLMACSNGQLLMAQWLHRKKVDNSQTDCMLRNGLHLSCLSCSPNVDLVEWLAWLNPSLLKMSDRIG